MKFEKINEDKVRIFINLKDLQEKNIDVSDFVSNTMESHELFLSMLREAEKECGLSFEDCQLLIEAAAASGGVFIVTITKIKHPTRSKKAKITATRKAIPSNNGIIIFSFESFDDFCAFGNTLDKDLLRLTISKNSLYEYKGVYYLSLNMKSASKKRIKLLYSVLCEFSSYIKDSDIFMHTLKERGTLICENRAIQKIGKHF